MSDTVGPMPGSSIPIWIPSLAAAALAAMWVQSAVSLRGRSQALASLAQRCQLMPIGDTLPLGMSLQSTDLQRWMRVRNGYQGVVNGREVAFFDLSMDWGSARWSRTVIARRSIEPLGSSLVNIPGLVVQNAGEWRILFQPRQFFNINKPFLPVETIEQLLRCLTESPPTP